MLPGASASRSNIDPIHDLYDAIVVRNTPRVRAFLAIEPRPAWADLIKLKNENKPKNLLLDAITAPAILRMLLDCYNAEISASFKNEAFRKIDPENHHSARILLNFCNADINADDKGHALKHAGEWRNLNFVRVLIQHCVNDIEPEDIGHTIKYAAWDGLTEIVKSLVPHYHISNDDEYIGDGFWMAAKGGHNEIISTLLDAYNAHISAEDKGHALYVATDNNKIETVSILLARCQTDIVRNDILGALYIATLKGHEGIVQILLQHHPIAARTPDARLRTIAERYNPEGVDLEQALIWGALMGRQDIVHILIDLRRFPNISADAKAEALQDAAEWSQTAIVMFLFQFCSKDFSADHKFKILKNAVKLSNISYLRVFLADPAFLEVAHLNNNEILNDALEQVKWHSTPETRDVVARLMQIPAVAELANQPPDVVIAPVASVFLAGFETVCTSSSSDSSSAFPPDPESHKRFRRG